VKCLNVIFLCFFLFSCGTSNKNKTVSINNNSTKYSDYKKEIRTITFGTDKDSQKVSYFELNDSLESRKKGTILFIHGIPTSSWIFYKTAKSLAKQGYHILAPDMPGFGQTKASKNFDYSLKSYAQVIVQLILKKELKNINLVMHDFGGPFSWMAIENLKIKDRFKQIYLLNTIASSKGFKPMFDKTPTSFFKKRMANTIAKATGEKFFQSSTKTLLSTQELNDLKEPLEYENGRIAYKNLLNLVAVGELRSDIKIFNQNMSSFKGETFIFWGMKDHVLNLKKQAPQIKKVFSNLIYGICLSEISHFPSLDKADELSQFIDLGVRGKTKDSKLPNCLEEL